MPKRFTDTDKWNDPWFSELSLKDKIIWLYVLDSCDHAGTYKHNERLLHFHTGQRVDIETLCKLFENRFFRVSEEIIFIPKFLKFQYPKGLGGQMPALVSVRKRLDELNLNYVHSNGINNSYETLKEQFNNTCQGVKDMDMDMVKDLDKEKDKEKDKNFEAFWIQTKFPKRPQDAKGDMRKKFEACLKSGLTFDEILFSSDVFAEVNRGNEYAIGMRRFLVPDTVREYLTENVKEKAKPKSAEDEMWDAFISKAAEYDKQNELEKF